MADDPDQPFPMDEELPSELSQSSLGEASAYSDVTVPTTASATTTISPCEVPTHMSAEDPLRESLRTKLSQFVMDDSDRRSQKEDTPGYDEDLDDKFDHARQAQIEEEYLRLKRSGLDHQNLCPPENFAPVVGQIYRSSFPQPANFPFVKRLRLKSVLCLIPEEYPQIHEEFFKEQGIKLFQMGMSGNKEPFVRIPHDTITEALKVVLNPENQPILIHCNRGKHRTGCLVGVLRRLQRWSLTIIFDEYRKFAAPKERPMDQQFIELYNDAEIRQYAEDHRLLPLPWD